jgi:hypothetical protein
MFPDGNMDSQTPSHQVFIMDSPLHHGKTDAKVEIRAFGPNMSNNEKLQELESFMEIYPKDCKRISLFIYTNNDKNKYNYQKPRCQSSFEIKVNPSPSKRDKTEESFLYALCEHASAATAALHCISNHISRASSTTSQSNTDDYVLDIFDSDMTMHDGFRNESKISTQKKDIPLYKILKDLPPMENTDLITRLSKHRRVSYSIY